MKTTINTITTNKDKILLIYNIIIKYNHLLLVQLTIFISVYLEYHELMH